MYSKDNKELIIDCNCSCSEGVKVKIVKEEDYYFYMSYISGKYNTQQEQRIWRVFCNKIKRIWNVIRGKDYCFSEICMSKEDFQEYKKFIADVDCN